jgi:RNA polymerase sigma factor (sigma-70 family)
MEERASRRLVSVDSTAGVREVRTRTGYFTFEALVGKLSPTLRRITRKLNGHFTFMDDQDLFQEALIHLWSGFQSGVLDDKTDSYILQGCYFHLKNYIRKSQDPATLLSLNSMMEEDGLHLEEMLVADGRPSCEQVETMLEVEAMTRAGASQRERDVLFFCLEGLTTREIGKKLGISHVSVVKIRNKIRERYEKLSGRASAAKDGKALAAACRG